MCSHEAELSERVSQQDCSGHSPLLPPPVFWLLLPPPHSLHYWRGFSALTGRQLKMVCDCLVLVGATAKTSWSEVASSLTHYLTHHPDQLPHLLVCLSSILHLIVSEFLHLSLSLQLPFSAVLQEVHRGEWSSPQRQSFHSSVLPSLLEQVWALHSPHALWLAYRLARRASAKAGPPHTHTYMHTKLTALWNLWNFNPRFSLNMLAGLP